MRVITAPNPLALASLAEQSVFLAGSTASDWRGRLASRLADTDLVLLDPVRPDWGAGWGSDYAEPGFAAQVDWELDAQARADAVVVHFEPGSRAPVSLMELGLWAQSGKALACCPPGYWARGHVQAVCARFGVPLVDSLEGLERELRRRLFHPSRHPLFSAD